jgi:hypothetical protein
LAFFGLITAFFFLAGVFVVSLETGWTEAETAFFSFAFLEAV